MVLSASQLDRYVDYVSPLPSQSSRVYQCLAMYSLWSHTYHFISPCRVSWLVGPRLNSRGFYVWSLTREGLPWQMIHWKSSCLTRCLYFASRLANYLFTMISSGSMKLCSEPLMHVVHMDCATQLAWVHDKAPVFFPTRVCHCCNTLGVVRKCMCAGNPHVDFCKALRFSKKPWNTVVQVPIVMRSLNWVLVLMPITNASHYGMVLTCVELVLVIGKPYLFPA